MTTPIKDRVPRQGTISESGAEFGTAIRKEFPNCYGVAVCAFGIVTSYIDRITGETVAELLYNYPNDGKYRMFGYNYKLNWKR